MRLPPRRVLTPTSGPSAPNKRKDRDDGFDPPKPLTSGSAPAKMLKPDPKPRPGSEPTALSNQLLAGYLAHEFLTRGTLFGQPWDPPYRVEEEPAEKMKGKVTGSENEEADAPPEKRVRYVEVSDLLKEEGPTFRASSTPPSSAASYTCDPPEKVHPYTWGDPIGQKRSEKENPFSSGLLFTELKNLPLWLCICLYKL